MIDFKDFQFACPPRTGTLWALKAMATVDFSKYHFIHSRKNTDNLVRETHVPFPKTNNQNKIKVSLVRHPCDWLTSYYLNWNKMELGTCFASLEFNPLFRTSFIDFVQDYLYRAKGAVGRLYNKYQADTCLRIEDCPWAMLEFLSCYKELSNDVANEIVKLPKQNISPTTVEWDPKLHKRVMEVEKELTERYDYH